jgi:hypothetical protein
VASDAPPKYERKPVPMSFARLEVRVRELLAKFPEMPATVIAEQVGCEGSIYWFRDNVQAPRVQYRRSDPVDQLSRAPGDAA